MMAVHVAACMAIFLLQFVFSVHSFAEGEPAPAFEPAPVEESEPSPSGSGSGVRGGGGGSGGGEDDSTDESDYATCRTHSWILWGIPPAPRTATLLLWLSITSNTRRAAAPSRTLNGPASPTTTARSYTPPSSRGLHH